MHHLLLTGIPDHLSFLKNEKTAFESMLAVALLSHELSHKTLVACTPADRQPSLELLFDLVNFVVEFSARQTVNGTCRYGIHGRELEQSDRFFDVVRHDC